MKSICKGKDNDIYFKKNIEDNYVTDFKNYGIDIKLIWTSL